jgi:hypothetical protein
MLSTLTSLAAALALALPQPARGVLVAADCGPPLTREASDAYLKILRFMAGVVQGFELGPPSQEDTEVFAQALGAEYCRSVTDDARAFIAEAPAHLIELRTAWPDLEESQRAQLREQWRQQLAPLLPKRPEPTLATVDSMLDVQRRVQFVSEMLRISHETQMGIIRNMGPSCPYWRSDCK